jgi:phage shock protein C
MNTSKKLYRSKKNRMIAGVCGGLGEYFDVDPTLIRLLWVIVFFMGGSGVLIYTIFWIVLPEEEESGKEVKDEKQKTK